jgi:hypothetical protein
MRSLHFASISSPAPVRRGGVLLELILSLPLLVILLLAVVEYAVLMSNQQHLEMAARAGGLISTTLELPETGAVPNEVLDVIAVELANIGIDLQAGIDDGSIRVELEHNYDTNGPVPDLDPSARLVSGTLDCPPPNSPAAPDPDASVYGRSYIRLSVCVRSDLLTPNLLSAYCIDMSERVTSKTKTYRHAAQTP